MKCFCAYTAFFILLILTLGSCQRELELPPIGPEQQLVLLGEFCAGDTAMLRAGLSAPVAAGAPLQFGTAQGLSLDLEESGGQRWGMQAVTDWLQPVLSTTQYRAPVAIAAGGSYRIRGHHAGLGAVDCHVSVPAAFTAELLDTAAAVYAGAPCLKLRFRIQDPGQGGHYYVIEALRQPMHIAASYLYAGIWKPVSLHRSEYDSLRAAGLSLNMRYDTTYGTVRSRLPLFTDDARTENLNFGNAINPFNRILLRNAAFSGQSVSVQVFVSRADLSSEEEAGKGRVLLQLKSVSADYFRYLRSYEPYQMGLDPVLQPVQIEGNVQGGLGVVGGVYRHEFPFLWDRWTF